MKKFLKMLPVLPFIFNSWSYLFADNQDVWELKKFYVTAYYSPLPDQQFYLRWNFADEVKLNWEGKNWASWKAVHPWMLAAPKSYAFWTKIFLEWVWIWTVEDRWWAIVWSWSRGYDADRIDVWMGYGDEWLKRALTWWKRAVYGRVIAKSQEESLPSIAIENFKIWAIDYESLKNAALVWKNSSVTTPKTVSISNIVPQTITKTSQKDIIIQAQKILTELWYFSWDINWVFSTNMTVAILSFQIDNNVVKDVKSKWAWNYWPATKKALSDRYLSFLNEEKIRLAKEKARLQEVAMIESKVTTITNSMWLPKENEVWSHVRKLQKTLKVLGYFKEKDTAIYWLKTKESILKYQISKWLVTASTDQWAGKIWEKTLSKLREDLKNLALTNHDIIKSLES
ncbi:MAG: hypothetical protein ACD_2C00110G0010 [uncultured bacterium (gcode 4)]|uniref:Peptidoglycan binding-like domain-containing protein n=1 Tax=uncultured bacterium (gcode 4) TaxID=1234023 RepID=K2H1L8_9BACT|nr:MAG: hypothetical protein ACD_2C00110G0010 [uncultured bacterium (gcode 4)]